MATFVVLRHPVTIFVTDFTNPDNLDLDLKHEQTNNCFNLSYLSTNDRLKSNNNQWAGCKAPFCWSKCTTPKCTKPGQPIIYLYYKIDNNLVLTFRRSIIFWKLFLIKSDNLKNYETFFIVLWLGNEWYLEKIKNCWISFPSPAPSLIPPRLFLLLSYPGHNFPCIFSLSHFSGISCQVRIPISSHLTSLSMYVWKRACFTQFHLYLK